MSEEALDRSLLNEAAAVLRMGCTCGIPMEHRSNSSSGKELRWHFQEYIDKCGLANLIDLADTCATDDRIAHVVKPGCASLIGKVTIYVSKKVELSEWELTGLLAHEVGTHALRMLNDDQQIWARNNRKSFALKRHYSTEEGLACLNSIVVNSINGPSALLWFPALRYWAATMCASKSFGELYEILTPYIMDEQSRFRFCQRAKRTGARDQAYFIGAIDLLRHINETDFTSLYSGMIHRDDSKRLSVVTRSQGVIIPAFLSDMNMYMQKLRQIAEINGIQVNLITTLVYSPRRFSRETCSSRSRSLSRRPTVDCASTRRKSYAGSCRRKGRSVFSV